MVQKKSIGDKVFDAIIACIVMMISIACIYPMLYVLFGSFSDPMELLVHKGILLAPAGFSLEGYKVVFNNPNLGIGYMNTLFYVIVGTGLNMLMTIIGGYCLAARGWKGRKQVTMFIIFTMYFSGGMIPNFVLIKNLGLLDSRWAIILPSLIATWNMIVMRTAFASIPPELDEAARIDGANDITILFQIYVPVAKATIAVLILFYSVTHWNSYFSAMIYLPGERELWPLQLFLRETLLANAATGVDATVAEGDTLFLTDVIKYAMVIVSTVPILCVYPFIQKYFNKGVMMGSLKG